MSLNADVAAQFPVDMTDIYGEPGTYHVAATNTDLSINVIPDRNSRRRQFEGSDTFEREMMEFLVRYADVANPADGYNSQAMDYITFETTKWWVLRITERNVGGLHRLLCSVKAFREG
jgi:hypothetical protein